MPAPAAEIILRPDHAIQPVTAVATNHLDRAANLVLDSVGSDNTRRAYRRALLGGTGDILGFLPWLAMRGQGMDKAAVNAYRRYLEAAGLAASSINQALAAVRKLAVEAADAGWMSDASAQAVKTAPGVKVTGSRTGNWLTKEQARDLLDAPDAAKLSGLRDRALLALLVGCALRRDEAARLLVADVQQRDGRWVIVDMAGKHGRIRTVPMPSWTKVAIDAWTTAAGITDGSLLRPVHKSGEVVAGPMTPQAIYARVLRYARGLELAIAPHDLRRTFAQLARKGGAPIEQIQISLGHASIATTERYLGGRLDLADAACDRLGIG
jgi:integrase/recombinase XerD